MEYYITGARWQEGPTMAATDIKHNMFHMVGDDVCVCVCMVSENGRTDDSNSLQLQKSNKRSDAADG